MGHYTSEIKVLAAPDSVFDYVKDPKNMGEYLPTVHMAEGQGPGRIEVDGEANGHAYHADGWFKVDEASRSMTWGSDGEHKYAGRLDVRAHEDHSHVSVSLDFDPNPGEEKAFDAEMQGRDSGIQRGLDESLRSIKGKMEKA